MTAQTIKLQIRDAGTSNPALVQFNQMFARNLHVGLSERNIVPKGEGDKAEKLASLLDVSAGTIKDWLMGRSLPDAWQLSKLAKLLNVPADTLISPDKGNKHGALIDEDYHCITLHDETHLSDGYSIYMLPETLRHMNLPRSTTIMTISGDDMSPLYRPNDHVIYDPRVNTISTNGIYVLRLHGQAVIRRTQKITNGKIRILCDNPAFPPEEYPSSEFTKNPESEDRIYVIGRALGVIRVNNI